MSIANLGGKGKLLVEKNAVFSGIVVIIVGITAFGLGKLSEAPQTAPAVAIEGAYPNPELQFVGAGEVGQFQAVPASEGQFVASRNSSKYHYPWCPGAKRINDENKVWFATREAAELAGYEPAKNCEGL